MTTHSGFSNRLIWQVGCIAGGMLIIQVLLLCGCQLHQRPEEKIPAVDTRFTANPLACLDSESTCFPLTTPERKIGLVMQSGLDPVFQQFAMRLGVILQRELQLSPASLEVRPILPHEFPGAAVNDSPIPRQTSDVVTVSFQDVQETLPPLSPILPDGLPPAPPIVDQFLVIRVLEYRPYFPMLATLELRVLDGQSQQPVFSTTASWSGIDYRLGEHSGKRKWFERLTRQHHVNEPSPEHNSPQALMHEIAVDIAAWYSCAVNPPVSEPTNESTLNDWLGYPYLKRQESHSMWQTAPAARALPENSTPGPASETQVPSVPGDSSL